MQSSRDKILMLILPSLVVLLVYGAAFSLPHYRTMTGLEKSLKTAQDAVPKQVQIQAKQRTLADLKREMDKLRQEEKALKKSWDDQASAAMTNSTRSDRLTRLIQLLGKHKIHVVHHGPHDGSGEMKELKLSASHERLAALMGERSSQKPQTWRLHLIGSYPNMEQTLRCLCTGDPVAIPVSVVMKEALPASSMREWWMDVWI